MQTSAFDEDLKEELTTIEVVYRNMDETILLPMEHRKASTTDGPFVETKEYLG